MNKVIGGNYKGATIKQSLIYGRVVLRGGGGNFLLAPNIKKLRSGESTTDLSTAASGAFAFGATGAILGVAAGKTHNIEVEFESGRTALMQLDSSTFTKLNGDLADLKAGVWDGEKKVQWGNIITLCVCLAFIFWVISLFFR